ncbi:hypothetical protein BJV78DRAFT_385779 [Lactifluus subvellereus]|nr:hypothetical protein BJV78DRAFT_385779 [Lactifluus subvellereus]
MFSLPYPLLASGDQSTIRRGELARCADCQGLWGATHNVREHEDLVSQTKDRIADATDGAWFLALRFGIAHFSLECCFVTETFIATAHEFETTNGPCRFYEPASVTTPQALCRRFPLLP